MSHDDANDIKGLLVAIVFALTALFVQGCVTKTVPQHVRIITEQSP